MQRDESRTHGLDRLELIRFLQVAQTITVHHGALAYLLGINALRASEAAAVRIEDYSESLRGHRVLRLVGKGNEPATMPITVPVLRVLEACRGERTEGPLVLRPLTGNPIDRRDAYRMVTKIAAVAGIPRHIRPHSLRHAASTRGASSSASGTSTTTVSASPPFAGVVDIGGGRQLYAQCSGSGSPTVVFESGDESDTYSWSRVLPGVVPRTRTCAYDRLGNGQSSAPVMPCRDLADLQGDFEAVLREAAAQPPYILVGASGGGFLVVAYAMAHPENVAGLVLVDTPKAVVLSDLPKAVREGIACGSPSNQEHRDFAAIEHAVWDHRRTIGDVPVTVISNDYGNVTGLLPEQQTNVEDQRGWFVLSPSARQVVVTSGHDIAGNEATLLTREILNVLELAQAS